MVKKHSKSLGKTSLDEQEASDVEMDSNFWHGVFDVYFVRCMESRRRQDDDLLFFVRKLVCSFLCIKNFDIPVLVNLDDCSVTHFQSCKSYALTENEDAPAPYFVRRWAPKVKTAGNIKYLWLSDVSLFT